MRDNLVRLLPTGRKNKASSSSKASALVSSRQAAFLFLRRPEKLGVEEQERVAKLRQINPEVERAYDLVQQRAGLSWWINNGMVEGHVTKLKLIRKTGLCSGGLCSAAKTRPASL